MGSRLRGGGEKNGVEIWTLGSRLRGRGEKNGVEIGRRGDGNE